MKKINLLISLTLIILGLTGQVYAIPTISLDPRPTKIHAGENLFVDVNISGLNNTLLGAFSMDVHFDKNLIFLPGGSGAKTYGDRLGNVSAGEAIVGATPPVPGSGVFSFYEVSLLEGSASTCVFCTGPYLENLQSDDTFKLATLAFYAPFSAPGPTITFSTDNVVLSDDLGYEIPLPYSTPPSIPVKVSEPPSFFLFGLGLMPLWLSFRLKGLFRLVDKHEKISEKMKLHHLYSYLLLVMIGFMSNSVKADDAACDSPLNFPVTLSEGGSSLISIRQGINLRL